MGGWTGGRRWKGGSGEGLRRYLKDSPIGPQAAGRGEQGVRVWVNGRVVVQQAGLQRIEAGRLQLPSHASDSAPPPACWQ